VSTSQDEIDEHRPQTAKDILHTAPLKSHESVSYTLQATSQHRSVGALAAPQFKPSFPTEESSEPASHRSADETQNEL